MLKRLMVLIVLSIVLFVLSNTVAHAKALEQYSEPPQITHYSNPGNSNVEIVSFY